MSIRGDQVCRLSARIVPASADDPSLLGRLRIDCPLSARERSGAECASCERFIGFGFSAAMAEAWVTCRLPCTCCGSRREDAVEVADVVLCMECRERARAVDEDDELGVGD